MVDSPEQQRVRIRDSYDLALQVWMGSAGFDRDEDAWPRRRAETYVAFAAGEKRAWLHAMGHRNFPVVGWAERGGWSAMTHGSGQVIEPYPAIDPFTEAWRRQSAWTAAA
jgi:predicted oxidoreductase